MPKTCCVPGCLNRNDLYKFPLFNQIIFDIWKQRIANPRFKNLSDQRIYHMYSVCPEHFIEECKTTDKRQLKKYSLPNINVPGFHEEPNIRNAFYSPKKAGQGDIPKFNKADTNDKNSANETGRSEIIQDDKLNTKPCEQTQPVVRIVKEKQICSSSLRINKLKNDKIKRVHFAKNVLIKEFVKDRPTISLSRNVPSLARAIRTENIQGDDLKSIPKHGILKTSGRTQPVAHECTEKIKSSYMIRTLMLKNTQTKDIINILESPRAEEKKTEETITNTPNAVSHDDKIKPIRMIPTGSKACVDSKTIKMKRLSLTGISTMSIVPYENTYLCTYSEQPAIHSPVDAI